MTNVTFVALIYRFQVGEWNGLHGVKYLDV